VKLQLGFAVISKKCLGDGRFLRDRLPMLTPEQHQRTANDRFGSLADIFSVNRNVRKVPQADIGM
jgi:hypothetical protein